MDENTRTVVELVTETDLSGRDDLTGQAGKAFLDYLAALFAARREPAVRRLLPGIRRGRPEDKALAYGFASHYLDYDDAQANIAGHFSTVLYSALLAAARPEDTVRDFLAAYVAGAELEGLLGACLNPAHRQQGWHSTGTIGPLGAAAAIIRLRHLSGEQAAMVLSLAATQSSGMAFEAGSDGKPLHAGFAASHALAAWRLVAEYGLSARTNIFQDETGWLAVFSNGQQRFDEASWRRCWLQPGQILEPGLWMKRHRYCSAAICAADGAAKLYEQGVRLGDISRVLIHFPPGADRALRYEKPQTGREGQFSAEYVVWQILAHGGIDDAYFQLPEVPAEFLAALPKFQRVYDVGKLPLSVRAVPVTAIMKDGTRHHIDIRDPQGSPANPLTLAQEEEKVSAAWESPLAARLIHEVRGWPAGTIGPCLTMIEGVIFDEVIE